MMKLKCDDCDVPDVNHTMRFSYFEKIKEEYEANVIRFEISFIFEIHIIVFCLWKMKKETIPVEQVKPAERKPRMISIADMPMLIKNKFYWKTILIIL